MHVEYFDTAIIYLFLPSALVCACPEKGQLHCGRHGKFL